ncbi:MAG: response regulator transcription factor [Thermoanaerobaculia bacterium]|nr:response regulator transcription factor [Thermoanaerobaculia bacterium]
MSILRLILVGEYHLFRECLASMLASSGRFEVAAQVDRLADARPALVADSSQVVLVDVGRAETGVLEVIKVLSEEFPEAKLVALGLEEREREILPFIEAGAKAYVLKEASVQELTEVIERVERGEAICSPQIASSMFSRLADLAREQRRSERLEALNLTPREIEILQLIADGCSNKEIGEKLFLSFHTVKNHVHNILEKLKVEHRSQAVELAVRKRWVREPQWSTSERG